MVTQLQPIDTTRKDELLDVIFWLRVIFGIILGVACGVIGVEGVTGFIVYVCGHWA